VDAVRKKLSGAETMPTPRNFLSAAMNSSSKHVPSQLIPTPTSCQDADDVKTVLLRDGCTEVGRAMSGSSGRQE
jgi:hypothetical protein